MKNNGMFFNYIENSFTRATLYLLIVLVTIPAFSRAQIDVDTITVNTLPDTTGILDVNIMDFLPPLAVLLDSALKHSPEKAHADALIEAAEYDVALAKKDWSKDVRLNGGYTWTYGNQVLDQAGIIINNGQLNRGYNFGFGLTIPLNTWYGRQDRINKAEAVRESQEARYNEIERQVRERVIETYSQLLLQQRLLNIISEAKESSRIISEMAEDRFRDGELTLDQLGQTTELKARYAAEYEQLRTQFSNTYMLLERLVGVPFSKFKTIRQKLQ